MPEAPALDLTGRAVVVTGAASGIGAATAASILSLGAGVVAADRDADRLYGAVGDADRAAVVVADVASEEGVEAIVGECETRFGRVDGFVAAAGITRAGTAEEMTPDTWDEVQRVNLRSVFLAARAAIPRMRRAGGGSFVAVASQMGHVGMPRNVAYCAAKAGVINLVRAMALDHAAEGIRFNCVSPGPIDTPMLAEGYRQTGGTPRDSIDRVPMGRLGRPAEIAAAIAFLLSDAASYVTGTALVADGGFIAL